METVEFTNPEPGEKTENHPSFYQSDFYRDTHTKLLDRIVEVEVVRPIQFEPGRKYPLLILNDGQDNTAVRLVETLDRLEAEQAIEPVIVAGVVAGDRIQEYGVSSRADYRGRGRKAKAYAKFVTSELIPYLVYRYPIDPSPSLRAVAGYSMGGLSALDMAWEHPEMFGKVGVFSGSLWWRKRDAHSRFYADDRDRIMHLAIRKGKFKPGMKFWFQTGTRDEPGDRNHNGIIDSIDDTLDLIAELTKRGYRPFRDIQYLEIEGGEHNHKTWAEAMPHFLKWAFGKKPAH